jgi:hypothetical protein
MSNENYFFVWFENFIDIGRTKNFFTVFHAIGHKTSLLSILLSLSRPLREVWKLLLLSVVESCVFQNSVSQPPVREVVSACPWEPIDRLVSSMQAQKSCSRWVKLSFYFTILLLYHFCCQKLRFTGPQL